MRTAVLLLAGAMALAGCARDIEVVEEPRSTVVETEPPMPATSDPVEASPSPAASPSPEPPPATIDDVTASLTEVARGLSSPVLVTAPRGDARRFIVEQTGRVQVLESGDLRVFLDIRDRVVSGGERGLLGMAFHPDFPDDPRVFVHYSGAGGDTVLAEVTVDGATGLADAGSLRTLLTVDQPASNHNGGTVAFGPDGMLYLGLGDGGGANDRFGQGQRADTLLGAILRLDVATPGEYAIPADNPFVDGGGAPEVWLYGLRNPWRFAFDDDRIYIGDVGQNAIEEIDVLGAGTGGANLGWPILEGSSCFAASPCDADGTVLPTVEYRHADTGGCAVIGGDVYAGEVAPLRGHWFYGDLCAGFVRSIAVADDGTVTEVDWTPQLGRIEGLLSFGRDGAGEIYVTTQDGRVLRLVAELASADG